MIEISVPDEPALLVTTGRGELFRFADDGSGPEVTALASAFLVTRLRWWADNLERKAFLREAGVTTARSADA